MSDHGRKNSISRRGLLSRLGGLLISAAGLLSVPRGLAGGKSGDLRRSFEEVNSRTESRTDSPGRVGHVARLEPWDERFEFVINFQFGDERAGAALRRPYLAVYMEQPDGGLVRTIVLWAQENESWVRSLTRWFRADRQRRGFTDLRSTLTGATRGPGQYTVIWDGRDDDGELVEQGEYVLFMEAVRQGGRAHFLRASFDFGTTPFREPLDNLGSFSDVTVEFRERI